MEPEGFLLCPQKSATDLYPEKSLLIQIEQIICHALVLSALPLELNETLSSRYWRTFSPE
jgi:hypothetical protein